ncbi:putative adhesin [Nocardia sp. alder85J]|uniref:putative adhesin n=1 Tax=Nocardia sp. alder85J TaxID=2862949 RepID=UPI001CD2FD59|nr:hypothetical protein [Nocardia sp. alder85J]MCX4093963.1 hypothetical protein [Nocardia sp. alder85J]
MVTYIIAAHGGADFNGETIVPAKVSVIFYSAFGQCLENNDGLLLQSAIVDPHNPQVTQVRKRFPARAQWNGPYQQQPALTLTADWHGDFKAGIVHAEQNRIVENIGINKLLTLTGALGIIAADAGKLGEDAVVHCLFCLA